MIIKVYYCLPQGKERIQQPRLNFAIMHCLLEFFAITHILTPTVISSELNKEQTLDDYDK